MESNRDQSVYILSTSQAFYWKVTYKENKIQVCTSSVKTKKLSEAVTGKCLEVEEYVTLMSEQKRSLNKKQ